jgi:hypothetical protein
MSENVLTILLSVGGSLALQVIVYVLGRKKTEEETKSLIAAQYNGLVTTLNQDRSELRGEVAQNRETIKQQQRDNEECEYRHEVTELEMELIKKKIEFSAIHKETVFILDDNMMVINEFKNRFSKVSALHYRTFVTTELFLSEARREHPEILILDYMLDGQNTADDVIDQLGYEPKIIIMSADRNVQSKYHQRGIQFFYKDDHYVYRIAKAVIQHLHDKN